MFHIRRRIQILETRKKEDIDAAEDILAGAGIDVKTWDSEPMPVGGCGAQMRPSDWSGKKSPRSTQRDMIYHMDVYKEDEERARSLLKEHGLA